uniref:ARAD1D24420p n=1 Tax=Blastobotrys adeninivorans TaxID=409370 RepID=A0A060TA52_BLAAD
MTEDDVIPFPEIHPNPPGSGSGSSEGTGPSASVQGSTSSLQKLLAAYQKPQDSDKDAGNKPSDHYKNRLRPWRYAIRSAILPIIRWETPYVAALQRKVRTPALDLYFAMSANLGTHTFYAITLPTTFWYGIPDYSRGLVFVLAFGVYVTGAIKDLLCLPRPLSPPLHRLTMSGSAALEYGFPSTHTAHAVGVGVLLFERLKYNYDLGAVSSMTYWILLSLLSLYVFSIAFGRVYCGMHGFLDVICGGAIGGSLALFRIAYGQAIDAWCFEPSIMRPLLVTALVLLLVRIHPEPADDCPCFDDAVAFMGVLAGERFGQWYYSRIVPGGVIAFDYAKGGMVYSLLRAAIGIVAIAIWRPTMKRVLHAILPPLLRAIEKAGLSMPRKSFIPASQYSKVPSHIEDATFVEPYQLNTLFSGLSKAHRSDSVGPQSTADVYESLDYQEYQKRKANLSHRKPPKSNEKPDEKADEKINEKTVPVDVSIAHVKAPRVRYDVEVVTKLIVYAGIAILGTCVSGMVFVYLDI